jgi:putative ubiquitin-RnfH superfamily antitoxin RatB of RatAB toxin-antitoxin module
MDTPQESPTESENARMSVEVAFARPDRQSIVKLNVSEGTTAKEAIDRSGLRDEFPEINSDPVVGIFSKKVALEHILRDGDRVEIYRPLIADPKEARRKKANLAKANRAK